MGKKIDKKKIQKPDIWIPPKRCPLMKACTGLVAWDSFETMCNCENWIFCPKAVEEAKKYKRKPFEWKLVKEIGGFPDET